MSPKIVDKAHRQRIILQGAAPVFARRGYHAATIDEIAADAGVAKGSVYLAFNSKEDLFFALFEDFARGAMSGLDAAAGSTDAIQALETAILGAAEEIDRNEAMIPLTLEFWSVCGVEATRERFGRQFREMFEAYHAPLVELLRAGESRGEIKAGLPLDAIVSAALSMIDGLIVQQWAIPGVRVSDVLRKALPVFLSALKA